MTAHEVMAEAARAGIVLEPGGDRIHYRGPLTPTLREGLVAHRDQIVAALKLRQVHRLMGFSEEDVLFIEDAILSGRVSEIRIASLPAKTEAA